MSSKRQKLLFPKHKKASLTVWSLTYSGKNSVTKIGLLSISKRTRQLFLETENDLLVSKSAMTLFDSKIKINFEEEILYRVLIFVTPSVSRIRKNTQF